MSFGKNIQYLRKLRSDMTQENLAEKLGVSRQTVSKWELDKAQPEMDKAIELCKLFSCSLDNLFRNVFNMHGYVAAWVLPEGITPVDIDIFEQKQHKYAVIHIENPFENPFVIIPGAYKTLMDYMRLNNLGHNETDVIPCFETNDESMDIYIACE